MKNIADQLPPDIARQLHPDRLKNEQAYWAVRNQLLHEYHGQWITFADGRVIASGTSPVTVFHAGEATGLHPFFICVGKEEKPSRILLHTGGSARLKQPEYDDSPWPREELHANAWEAGRRAGWEDMDEYDDLPAKSCTAACGLKVWNLLAAAHRTTAMSDPRKSAGNWAKSMATMAVDALVDAGLIPKAEFQAACEVVAEEIYVHLCANDYPPPVDLSGDEVTELLKRRNTAG